MSRATIEKLCDRILEHCRAHDKNSISFTFHGGEPLLGGVEHLALLFETIERQLVDAGISVRFGMQSNGLLFSREIGNLLRQHHAGIGISIDGPPEVNDVFRVDHRGKGSSGVLHSKLNLLSSPEFKSLLTGFLVVVNLKSDPVEILDYLSQFSPPEIDFLLPYDNWDRRPLGKVEFDSTPYGDWLIKAFDYWYRSNRPTRIRQFASIMRLLMGGGSLVESIGLDPVTLVVIETNGDIEGLDSLKGTYEGATVLGLNVFRDQMNTAATHIAIQSRQKGADALCGVCQQCPVVRVCGGGYLPNRYSESAGFANPSIYCRDLEKLIRHIHSRILNDVKTLSLQLSA